MRRAPPHLHGHPGRGAADAAPTAPHATPPGGKDKSGPAGFWSGRTLRIVFGVAVGVSFVLHWFLAPWRLLPDRSGLEFKDNADELTIPVDLLGEEAPPPPPPAPPEQHEAPPPVEKDPNAANPIKMLDASAPKPKPDAQAPDASVLATDAGLEATSRDGGTAIGDGGAVHDAGEGDASADAGLVAEGDAGAGGHGPRDPGGMIGMPGLVAAGQVNVTLLVNVSVIRSNSVGQRMGPLLFAIPQWNDFMKGAQTGVDPIRDTEWILIYGPSLIHTDRDAVIVRYGASDALVDKAVDAIALRYDRGGAFDAGVPGVKASLGHADNAERVFLRVQPHVLAVVPKDKATEFARVLKRAPISPKVRPGEAMRLTVKDPWKQISIPGLKFSQSLKEIRLWVAPRAGDDGADVFVEGDCTDEAAADEVAEALTDLLRRQNSVLVRAATRGLLNGAKVVPDGSQVKLRLNVTQEQLEALLQAIGAFLGANVAPPAGGAQR
ncbi:hypothetical protein [Labilithrix luteola]|uniref:hypothetical protein n=1 Tax=Labilithrix luteola TaxID=1391654 RepID=UPI0011BA8293|nr:hypothetical protein [Labilithrix luteola]